MPGGAARDSGFAVRTQYGPRRLQSLGSRLGTQTRLAVTARSKTSGLTAPRRGIIRVMAGREGSPRRSRACVREESAPPCRMAAESSKMFRADLPRTFSVAAQFAAAPAPPPAPPAAQAAVTAVTATARPVAGPLRSGRSLSSSGGPARCSVRRAAGRAGFRPGAGLSVPRDTGTATHAMMSVMWVYMETWIINDGAAELARGSHLRGVGLRASCLSVGPARTVADGIAELADPGGQQGPSSHRYELTGVAGHAEDVWSDGGPSAREFVITAGDQAFLARTAGPASEVAVGSRVTAQRTLSVVAGYEWDAFGLPDLRTDWHVHGWRSSTGRSIMFSAGRGGALPATRARCFAHLRSNVCPDGTMTAPLGSWPGTCSM